MITDAKWISPPVFMGDVCPAFSKEITLRGTIKRAEIKLSAIGAYEAIINGERIGDFILAPGCTSYRKRLQYQTYNITDVMKPQNKIKIFLGSGWHRGRISAGDKEINNTPAAIIAEITLMYKDGTLDTIATDASWNVWESRIRSSDIYDGEIYDASAVEKLIGTAVINDSASSAVLIPQEGESVTEHERIKAMSFIITQNGEKVIDFGQNIAGYVEFKAKANRGDRVVISHAETLDTDGNFYTENYRSAKAMLKYTCSDGEQIFKPHFTFFGFRYIRIDEYPGSIDPADFTAIALYSDMERTGYIETGNEKVNKLYNNTLWSQRSNFIDIPTDCPQRDERMGWLGDAQVFAKTACYNYNAKCFFKKWLNDVIAEQREDGSIPEIVPNFWQTKRSSAAWGDAITIIPWQLYISYGDAEILKTCFDPMCKWVDYITHDTIEPDLWICRDSEKKLWGKHYGDWLALDAPSGSYIGSSNIDFIASAFYAYSTLLTVKTGREIGEDVSRYESLYERIVSAFKNRFTEYNTQTECVLALCFGLTDKTVETAKQLNEMIAANGNRLQTGFVGTPYLLHALSGNGYSDTAYKLLLQEKYPSWLYEVDHGATTIWEHWDGIRDDGTFWSSDMNSYNHYAYGSVVDWLYSVAAGIAPKEPGYKDIIVAPVPNRELGSMRATLMTEHGEIVSSWHYENDMVVYEITVPTSADIVIHNRKRRVKCGTYKIVEYISNEK